MATPHNAPYKKAQRAEKLALRRHRVLWVSCVATNRGDCLCIDPVQGTYMRSLHGELGQQKRKEV